MNVLVLSFVTTICLFQHTTALYFHIGETERKCFIEEVPDETNVMVNYKVELYDPKSRSLMPSSPGIGMHIEVRDPDDKMILSRVYSSEGRILFTSHTHGKYVFCMYSNSSARFNSSRLMVHLDIQIGERTVSYSDVVLKEKLSELQLRVGQFLDQVEEIIKEVNYRRYRGQCIRETSESTNSRVLWLSVTKITVVLLMGAWQMRHLKCFFEAIKLV